MTAAAIEPAGRVPPGTAVRAGGHVLVRRLGWVAAGCTLAAVVLGMLGFADIVDGLTALPVAVLFIVLAALGAGGALAAHRAQAALLGRLDLFGQALEASPDAQLVLAPDQTIAYANAAFHSLFPTSGSTPLKAIGARLENGGRSQQEFQRLLAHVAAGRHAVAALSIRESGEVRGWFHVSVSPLRRPPGFHLLR